MKFNLRTHLSILKKLKMISKTVSRISTFHGNLMISGKNDPINYNSATVSSMITFQNEFY